MNWTIKTPEHYLEQEFVTVIVTIIHLLRDIPKFMT